MSTEAGFRKVVFPDIQPAARSSKEDRGYTQGHAAGYAAGIRAAAAEQLRLREQLQAEHHAMLDAGRLAVAEAVGVLEAAAAASRRSRGVVLEDAQDVLAASAIELAEAILGYELDNGANTARAALARALGAASGAETITAVRLHPADLAALAAVDAGNPSGVELKADPALNPGDAIAEYPQGWLDARLSTALERAKAALLGNDA
ncbi:FliH/SctL family protein [Arthrobacter bambusae]|uniref:FliH/SctL family protein n=1 Tax=Arthrobacter bambusae TaxID=1338426 RepID=UPI002783C344|nr:FliH/SctL family protein [Arthrobacter bambusae]MDQ0029431.1 flagellar assembly protein FliH [Arthrobacter bambusae]MDQ0097091.1 flagellar assembly protein FliH [Arthrobacter bambusae]